MNERFTTIEAQLAILEVSNNSTRAKSQNSDEFHQTQEEQKKTRVAATGFHEDTTGQEAQELLTATILEAAMSTGGIQIKCPAKPITHASIQFADVDERDKCMRSAN